MNRTAADAALGDRWLRSGWHGATTIADEAARTAIRRPDAAVVFAGSRPARLTLGELHARAYRIAGRFAELGVGPGDAVAVQTPNWAEGVLAVTAAFMAGAVAVPVIHIYGPAELRFILAQTRARLLVVPDRWRSTDYIAHLDRLGPLPDLRHVVVIGDDAPAGTLRWADLERAAPARAGAPDQRVMLAADDTCLAVYTSGTTAEPKGVRHSSNTMLAELRTLPRAAGGPVAGAVFLAAFPFGHIAGMINVTRLLLHGSDTVFLDAWDPERAAELVAEHGVTATAGTPFHLTTLLDAAERRNLDMSTLAEFLTGAANVPPVLVARAEASGLATLRAYGSSEHPTVTCGRPDDPLQQRVATDGRPAPGSELRIIDDTGGDVPAGTDGEIVTRGPERFCGYVDPDLDRAAFLPGGWFRTGDVGCLDADGYLTVTDRKKDIIIRGGENISSKEVEDLLVGHDAVSEAAVVAAPDRRFGERVCAFVVLRPGASLDLPAVQTHFAAAGVARQKTPERLEVVDDLPRTAAGKVKKFELRAQLRQEEDAG